MAGIWKGHYCDSVGKCACQMLINPGGGSQRAQPMAHQEAAAPVASPPSFALHTWFLMRHVVDNLGWDGEVALVGRGGS